MFKETNNDIRTLSQKVTELEEINYDLATATDMAMSKLSSIEFEKINFIKICYNLTRNILSLSASIAFL